MSQTNLLLISNSTLHGSGYLDHCEAEIKSFIDEKSPHPSGKVAFIPFARPNGMLEIDYFSMAKERLERMGYRTISPLEMTWGGETPCAIFVGGGNTFVLLKKLENSPEVRDKITNLIAYGVPYIGVSAGANIACPTIMTTNDMPIVPVGDLSALHCIPFQINPHYIDPNPNSTHKGETRETRIKEYLAFNLRPVVGLREGSMVRVEDEDVILKGNSARVFLAGEEPKDYHPVCSLSHIFAYGRKIDELAETIVGIGH